MSQLYFPVNNRLCYGKCFIHNIVKSQHGSISSGVVVFILNYNKILNPKCYEPG